MPGSQTRSPDSVAPGVPEVVQVSLAEVGLDATAMDRSADPCTDFFQYACGGWLARTEIPADRSKYGRFAEVTDRNETLLRALLDTARSKSGPDPVAARLGQFYGACMDEPAIEQAGLAGIEPLLGAMRAVKRRDDVRSAITELHRHGIWAVFMHTSEPDFKDSSQNILMVDSAGLGMPDRDYYLKDEEAFTRARTFYRGHVQRMFELLGMSRGAARQAAGDVLRVETELARVTKTQVQRRDVPGMYNKIDRKGLIELVPSFGWDTYFEALGRPDLHAINVSTPAYFTRLETLFRTIKPRAWSHYFQWQLVHHMAPALPGKFVDEHFALDRALTDQPELAPRWKRCVEATDTALGELLGQRYVAEAFSGTSKEAARTMVREISQAFAALVRELDWMDRNTKEQALGKLEAMTSLIGYPDVWRSYDFAVDPAGHAANVLAARAFEARYSLSKAGKPYDRGEWFMTPQTVNAYYNQLANHMVFPAGMLQPPFFGKERGIAANLGGMGMVVGHELTHGFDDMGAQFDAQGNMRDWWQKTDAERFKDKGLCLADQYSQFEPLPGVKVNGKLTLGENIADLGGVKLAFRAYRSMRKHADKRYVAEGLSEDQQFFVATGQAWCTKTREAEVRRRAVVDSHSPAEFRVNGALRNTPEFAEAFACKKGTPMNPEQRCQVW